MAGSNFPSSSAEVECAKGLVKKHCPAGRADDPGNGHAATVRGKLVAALATFHQINNPRRSNWAPPSPNPKRGELPMRKEK